ncbi:UDP-N-acetylmuramate dehydrogenase [Nocardioides daejeonensis]|uniref:UDP-N-acetylmuramate dehydrogenase n=1 Tax=Nocardioides daejeonensis TaxID=1046556 RepID=UPI001EF42BF9|nr:UDP-N-acetylmuramate dehydrogenase [Nocardioides daejeonensis]
MPDGGIRLAELTTLRVGGAAARFVRATTAAELVAAVSDADAAQEPVLLVGGGSNLLVADDGFAGVVVQIASDGLEVADDGDSVLVTVQAGMAWDDLVARAVAAGWSGIEALSGIPGSVGATPIQNVGAYGQEVATTIDEVEVWDRRLRGVRRFAGRECSFGYRHSRFKADPSRFVVLAVTFRLVVEPLGQPVRYAELGRRLGVEPGERAPLAAVRAAVLALRAGKGMVLDPADHDTWSAGSFFTNPVLDSAAAARLPEDAPRYDQPDGTVKTSAAWLIEHAGFGKGFALTPAAPASLSTKHTLALTNRGAARASDLLALARQVRDGVETRFGVRLVNEPVLVNCSL